MKIKAPAITRAKKPGQFVIVIADTKSERIPLTISDFNADSGTVDIFIQAIGYSTRKLIELNERESILDFVGPLGLESEFIHRTNKELTKLKTLVIAGGVSATPTYPQVKKFHNKGFIGARSRKFVLLKEKLQPLVNKLYIATDNGSKGFRRNANQLQKKLTAIGNKYDLDISIDKPKHHSFSVKKTRGMMFSAKPSSI